MSEPESDKDDIDPKGNQPAVIESDESQIRVNAGAGTGKTSTMVWKIERQIKEQGANPERILALTFANKAATNVETRVAEELDSTLGYNISSYTYHSFCHQLLKEYAYYTDHPPDFELITESTSATLIQEIVQKIDFDLIEPMTPGSDGTRDNILEDTLDFIGEIKRSGHSPDDVASVLPAQSDVMRAHRAVQEIQHTSEKLWDLDALFADGGKSETRINQWLIDLRKELRAIIDEFDGESLFNGENGNGHSMDLLKDVEMDVSVELGKIELPLGKVLQLSKGSVIELEKLAGEPVDILVNGHRIAHGEVVVIDEHFGVRISNLITTRQRLASLK